MSKTPRGEYLGTQRHANEPDTRTLRVLRCVKCGDLHTVDVTAIPTRPQPVEEERLIERITEEWYRGVHRTMPDALRAALAAIREPEVTP